VRHVIEFSRRKKIMKTRTFKVTPGIARELGRVRVVGPYWIKAIINARAPERVTKAFDYLPLERELRELQTNDMETT
jgi:hypothetical protein